MTIDLWMVVASVVLCEVLILIAAQPALADPKIGFGNRESVPEGGAALQRAKRAAENLKENLPMFVALVLVAHVAGISNGTTALGAEIFFGARVTHAVVYIAGIPYLRTLVWFISMVGMGMIVSQMF